MPVIPNNKRWVLLITALLLLAWEIASLARSAILQTNDFVQYWSAGKMLLSGGDPYSPKQVLELERSLGKTGGIPLIPFSPPWAFWALTFMAPLALIEPAGVPVAEANESHCRVSRGRYCPRSHCAAGSRLAGIAQLSAVRVAVRTQQHIPLEQFSRKHDQPARAAAHRIARRRAVAERKTCAGPGDCEFTHGSGNRGLDMATLVS